MKALAWFIRRHNGVILLVALAISVIAAVRLPPKYDDDVLQFLPKDDPEVARLEAIVKRFGGLNVALVGVEATGSLFQPGRLEYVRALARQLKVTPEVQSITALTEIAIVDAQDKGDGGDAAGVHRELVPDPVPKTAEAVAALGKDILSRDFLVGSLVSEDGSSTRLIVQLREEIEGRKVSPTEAATAVRDALAAVATPPGIRIHFGGAPFIAEAAATASQEDLKRLGPWVCLVIVLSIVFTLGAIRAALLCLSVVGVGILWTVGFMAWFGHPFTLLSSSLPVMLVALGSAFAVHVLVWYLDHGGEIEDVLEKVGGPVLVSALTAIAGFLSFLFMDLHPMRAFGWQMALGSGLLGIVALVVAPAALVRFRIPARAPGGASQRVDEWLVRVARAFARRRAIVLMISVVATAFLARNLFSVRTSMDTRSFFEPGSAPDEADQFLVRQFGGSVFLQVLVDGDMRDPGVLRAVAAFEDRLRHVPGVTHVESFTKVLALVNEGLAGKRALARTRDGISQQSFLAEASDPAVHLLIDSSRTGTVIQASIGAFDTGVVERVTNDIRALAATHLPSSVVTVPRSTDAAGRVVRDAAERIQIVAGRSVSITEPLMRDLGSKGGGDASALLPAVAKILQTELVEEEMVLLKEGTDLGPTAKTIASLLASGTLNEAGFAKALEPVIDASELANRASYEKGARYVWKRLEHLATADVAAPIVKQVLSRLGALSPAADARIRAIVDDVLANEWAVPGTAGDPQAKPLSVAISGYPIIQETMTRSVHTNHLRSLAFSAPIVLLLLIIVFGSFVGGFLAVLPAGLTLVATYGLMGTLPERFPLDMAGSMLASIALGTGIDYAIHFLWRYRQSGLENAMRTTGRRVLINALEVSAGFSVLALATLVPMARFGILTAFTLAVAAIATLIVLPAALVAWKPSGMAASEGDEGDGAPPAAPEA